MALKKRVSLRWLFTGVVVLLLLGFGVGVALVTRATLRSGIEKQLETRGESLANLLARSVKTDLAVGGDPERESLLAVVAESDVLFAVVTADDGSILAQESAPEWNGAVPALVRDVQAAADGRLDVRDRGLFLATAAVVVERPVQEPQAGGLTGLDEFGGPTGPPQAPSRMRKVRLGEAVVGIGKQSLEREVDAATRLVATVTVVLLLVAFAIAFVVTSRVSAPLAQMVTFAVATSRGNYDEVGQVSSLTREVAELGDAFQVMRRSLSMVADQARAIAAGDLTRRVDGAGQLGDAFNAMGESLSRLVGQIKKASIQTASAGAEILAASRQAEKGSAEQASGINQTTTTMDELLSASKQIAMSADAVVKIAERTLAAAKAGEESVRDNVSGMEEIANNNRQTAERILELSERNQQIGNIVEIIDEIADKSDLLALNAAIEGAKAGEAGKGFAVVATEMRSLAENVVESTKEIKQLISEIQKASNATVLATEGQMKATERGTSVALKTGSKLAEILQMVESTTEAAKQISLATQQQRTGTEQVVQSMSEIARIAKVNVLGSSQTTVSTGELAKLAEDLKQAVSQFRLG